MSSPYSHPLEKIKSVNHYFRKNNDFSVSFIGETLELRIPKKFSSHGALVIGETVTTPGVMDMIFDDKYHAGLNLLASITIVPSDMNWMTYKGVEYLVLKLKHGDTFMTSYRVIQDPHIVYILWTEFITNGGIIYTLDYDALLKLFEHVRELTGSGIGVSRSVYEGIIAHLARDPDNISVPYRLTDMSKPMKMVKLKSISQASSSTIARLNGAYFRDEGLTSALRNEVDQQQPFENILRGISSGADENPNVSIA